MSYYNDILLKFEEDNWDWLVDKFLKEKEVFHLWADFVYQEYEKKMPDEDR